MPPKQLKCDVDGVRKAQHGALARLGAFNEDKKLIGEADISILKTDKKFIWLHEIEVNPKCRRKGVGEALITVIKEIGKENDAELVYAYPMQPMGAAKPIPQKKIEAFYKNQGFKPCNPPKDVATVTDEGLFKRGVCLFLKDT